MKPHEIAAISTTPVATVFVSLRLFTKLKVSRDKLGLDDYLNVAALVSAWVFAGMIFPFDIWIDRLLSAEIEATGPNDPSVGKVYEGGFDLFNAVTGIFFLLALTLARLSILAFYLRLSPKSSFRWTVHGVIIFLLLETIISIAVSLLVFDAALKEKIKAADQALSMFYGISNILVDIAILALPVGVIVPLQMSLRRKIAVLCLFGAGAIVCATSIYRVAILTFISSTATSSNSISNQLILSFAEMNGAIICGCVPMTARFFTQFLPEVLTPYLLHYLKSGFTTPSSGSGGNYSTIIERNRRRREQNQRHHLRIASLKDSGFVGGINPNEEQPGSQGGISGIKVEEHEMIDVLDMEGSRARVTKDSYDSLERNVLGKGRADTTICAQSEVFAPDRETGITCIHDTSISYGPGSALNATRS